MKTSSRPKAELSAAAEWPVLGAGAESPKSRNQCPNPPEQQEQGHGAAPTVPRIEVLPCRDQQLPSPQAKHPSPDGFSAVPLGRAKRLWGTGIQ